MHSMLAHMRKTCALFAESETAGSVRAGFVCRPNHPLAPTTQTLSWPWPCFFQPFGPRVVGLGRVMAETKALGCGDRTFGPDARLAGLLIVLTLPLASNRITLRKKWGGKHYRRGGPVMRHHAPIDVAQCFIDPLGGLDITRREEAVYDVGEASSHLIVRVVP